MYTSTRSKIAVSASKAIIEGIAKDGGLYVLDSINQLKKIELEKFLTKSYKEVAFEVMKDLLDDFDNDRLKNIIDEAYDNTFAYENVVDVKKCNDSFFLELFHGPTMAFKDVALSILPLLLKESKKIQNDNSKTIILTATSGDTGSAALSGFSKDENVGMVVLYPTCGVSLIQEKQMLSFRNNMLKPTALEGNFDDAQTLVKKVFNDEALREKLDEKNIVLSSANSINIGRLIPQIVYYIYSYLELVRKEEIKLGEKVNFVVPTGNFGNILACYMAMNMGVPVNKIICASNSNKVLTDFFKYNVYDKNREFIKTYSPSMDILISSNLERLLYYICEDDKLVNELMKSLKDTGKYTLPEGLKNKLNIFESGYASEEDTLAAIKKVYDENSYLIDTHTAVAYSVYKKYVNQTKDSVKTIIASTAHPYKFPKAVCKALGIDNSEDEFTLIEKLYKKTNTLIPQQILKINKEYPKEVWDKEEAFNKLTELVSK